MPACPRKTLWITVFPIACLSESKGPTKAVPRDAQLSWTTLLSEQAASQNDLLNIQLAPSLIRNTATSEIEHFSSHFVHGGNGVWQRLINWRELGRTQSNWFDIKWEPFS